MAVQNTLAKLDLGFGSLRSDARGFARLGRLHQELSQYSNCRISIDLSKVDRLEGHMAAPMKIVERRARLNGNALVWAKPLPDVETVLRKNLFLPGRIQDFHKTTMPVTEFDLESEVEFSQYAKKYLARPEMPKMTAALRGKFFEGIDELFANAALHSKSEVGVAVGGQFYPKQERLDFSVADGGRGIPGLVRSVFPEKHLSDPPAIDWAMQDNNTTRQGDIPGGLGSKILRDFIKLNGGKLIIASNGGFWCQAREKVQILRLTNAFPGTSVLLEVNTSDKGQYDLVSPPRPESIW